MLTPEQVARYVKATGNTRLKKLEICWFFAEAGDDLPSKTSESKVTEAPAPSDDERYARDLVDRLQAYRLKKELSAKRLAEVTGISESSIKGYFSKTRPRLPDLIKQDVIRRFLEAQGE